MNDRLIPLRGLFLALGLLIVSTTGASAAFLFWDAGNTNNSATIDPGSGAWDVNTTTNINWNNGTANVSWSQTSTTAGTMGAIFQGPGAAPGTYQVAIDGGQVAATNLVINASGYQFNGSPIYLNAGTQPVLMVSNGVNVVFSNNLTGTTLTGNNATAVLQGGDNGQAATVTVYGAITGWQPLFTSTNASVFYLANQTATANADGTCHINADVRMTNGTWNSGGALVVGRILAVSTQPNNSKGVLTLDGPTTILNQNNDYLSVGRDSTWNSTIIVQNGATLNDQVSATGGNPGIGIPRPGSSGANNQSWLKVYGGTVNMGTSARVMPISIANGGSRAGQISVLTQTGGVINAWAGVQFGGAGTYDGGIGAYTNSGGFLYLGANGGDGFGAGVNLPPSTFITLSGGTIGALQSWHSSTRLPIMLDTLNGNITFQCADSGGSPFNITLDQTLSGAGGFYKTGSGRLTLNGINSYAGSTVVSNGTLSLITAATASSNGPVTLDGSAGSPDLVLNVANQAQYWSVGTMTFASGTPQIDFQFGQSTAPSKTVAAIQVNGNLNFTTLPTVLVTNAGALSLGTYPLIAYTGTSSGTAPTSVTLPASGYCSGYLSNSPAAKKLFLVITQSLLTPTYVWGVNSGAWDFSTANWKTNGVSTVWQDGNLVRFDDTAPSGAPDGTNITVTLNTTVSPLDMSFNNLTNAFTIVGTGNLNTGLSGNLELLGGGTVTLATTNTFTGGTVVSGGSQLNLNSGGNGSGGPVGTGALTLNANARLGNSSGAAVALQYPVQKEWNGSFSYVGNSDLDLGAGQVDLNETITVTVATNNLIVEGSVTDNGQAKQLTKAGNGTLTLAGNNSWNGLKLQAGQLNMNNAGAAGSGFVTILGGAMDNTSAADVTLSASAYHMSSLAAGGVFTFVGTTNLDLGGGIIDANNSATIVLNVLSNTLKTAGIQSGNTILVKTGNGTWALGGADLVNNAVVTVNQGELDMARDGGSPAIGTGAAGDIAGSGHGLVVNSNAVAKITGSLGNQISHAAGGNSYIEVILNAGVLDLNGQSQAVDMISMTNGVVRNSAASSFSIVTVAGTGGSHPTNAITLTGTNCQFGVASSDAAMEVNALINGSGTLVKTGLGALTLDQSNLYTGNITVSAGTLNLTYPDIAASAVVTVASNAVLNLNFANGDTNTVAVLVINGTNATAGVHNNTTDPTFITGTGSLLVVPPPTINPLPGPIQFSVSGSTLNLAWPTNAGWLLLAQTNSLGVGIGTNWVTIPGSGSITNLSIPMSPANGATFYRLLRPF